MRKRQSFRAQALICELWRLQSIWEQHTQPGYNKFGLYSFRRIDTLVELEFVVRIQDSMKEMHRKIRAQVGTLKYILFLIAPLASYEYVTRQVPSGDDLYDVVNGL